MAISIKKVLYLILGTFLLGCSSIKHVSGSGSLSLTSARLLADSIISAPEDNRPSINSTNLANIPTPDEWKQRVDLCQQGDSLIVSAVFRSATPDSVSAHVAGDTLYLDFDCSASDTAWHHTRISVNHLTFPKSGYLPIRFCGKYVLPIMPSADTISYPLLDTIWGEGADQGLVGFWQKRTRHNAYSDVVMVVHADGSWLLLDNNRLVDYGVFNAYSIQYFFIWCDKTTGKLCRAEYDVLSDPTFDMENVVLLADELKWHKMFVNRCNFYSGYVIPNQLVDNFRFYHSFEDKDGVKKLEVIHEPGLINGSIIFKSTSLQCNDFFFLFSL